MKLLTILVYTGILLTATCDAYDAEEVKEMYQQDCTKCHDSSVFTRPAKQRKVNDLAALKQQVSRCVAATGVSWFDEDEENMVQYLNKTFYKFKKSQETKK